ncbi:MAG: peptide ABC transporter permease [Acidobacteria bacterium]|nr:MAG: peptide ABC transporter permease [Acidobacteriota bacterium]
MKEDVLPPIEETAGAGALAPPLPPKRSVSIFRKRVRKFKTLKRGYYSFVILLVAYAISFILPVLINNKPLIVHYHGKYYFPMVTYYPASEFGQNAFGEPNYRELKREFASRSDGDWVLMPIYPYSATESLLDLPGSPPHPPSRGHIFGTDDRARDVFVRLAYGFNVSLTFALLVLAISYVVGVFVGAMLGYFGGKLDILGQRAIEIWSSLPFLYTIIIVSSIIIPIYIPGRNLVAQPSFWLLIAILTIFDWMGITYYVRGEFYREKAKDYVGAAIAMGVSEPAIMFKHILPNALTPVVSFAPFGVVANIEALVALDFLGFGLPAPTPSWGELISQGTNYLTDWWLVFFPLAAVFVTLLLIVFIGEAVREAFDPKEYSRLR